MGAIFLVRDDDPAQADDRLAAARAQFGRHGFGTMSEVRCPGWRLLHAPYALGGPEAWFATGDDFVVVAGTLTYDGTMGRAALAALLNEASLPAIDWTKLAGQFVAVVRKAGRTFLLTDYFATFQVFRDASSTVFSTSLLAAVDSLPSVSFDTQAVYEYALNIAPIGDESIFAELKRVGPDAAFELTATGAIAHPLAKPLPDAPVEERLEDQLDQHRDRLMDVVRPYAAFFGNEVHTPLSGGLDSRLLLAALRAQGCRPKVYVYGPENSVDVEIARTIGQHQGFAVEWIDKAAYRDIAPDEFGEQVARNFHELDAVPNFGGLFDNGGNEAARKALHAGGALAASGGCGEVYRDFFYLADRPLRAATVARSFFARYARPDLTDRFDEGRFLRAIEGKILHALGRPGDRSRLSRTLIEQIYPRVRCRAFFGREISLVAREGAYLMPFLDHRLVQATLTLPTRVKQAGRFQAALLNAIDPALAREQSAYGHDFTVPPGWRHRLSEWSTRARPAWLRQRSYELRRRLRPMSDEHGGLLSPDYLGRVVDLRFPAMRRYFQVDRVADPGIRQRLACLEYLAAYLGSRLADN